MLTRVCCGSKLSSDVGLVKDKLRRKGLKPMKFFSTFPRSPIPLHNRESMQNALFLPPSPVCLVFILRQSSVIPVYKTNAGNKHLVGESLHGSQTASVGSTGYRLEAILFCFYLPGCLKPCGTWKCGLLSSLSFCDWRSAVQPFFLLGCPGWYKMAYFSPIILQFSLSLPQACWLITLPSTSGLGSVGAL